MLPNPKYKSYVIVRLYVIVFYYECPMLHHI